MGGEDGVRVLPEGGWIVRCFDCGMVCLALYWMALGVAIFEAPRICTFGGQSIKDGLM